MTRLTARFVIATAILAYTGTSVVAGPLFTIGKNLNPQPALANVHSPLVDPGILRQIACPDLKVSASQHPNPDGSIAVEVRVANISTADYVSDPAQQMLVIEGHNGGHSGMMRFAELASGRFIQWNDTFEPFEFPATYNAYVAFDPDILLDGNPQNDDCRASNNQASLTTAR
ncbi:MAG: hypothetical protein H6873_06240 [Hyphomicrobiaceae bacterium]|nr:hypothetical protein [Hyphomicrobiaceae bacterium]